MSLTSISPAASRPAKAMASSLLREACRDALGRLLKYWHLFSLDAPTVAVVWCATFAAAARIRLPFLTYGMLFMATWGLYVADRLLDGIDPAHARVLRDRHSFHARHRRAFLAVATPMTLLLAWLVSTRMNVTARGNDLLLAAAAGLYLLCVHVPVRRRMLRDASPTARRLMLPKELSVAVIFAIACAIPAWSRPSPQPRTAHGWLLAADILFALLCWLNCIAIESWEAQAAKSVLQPLTRAIGDQLRICCLTLAAASLCVTAVATSKGHSAFCVATLSIAASALLLGELDRNRLRIAPLPLRAAADAVLLTPAVFLPLAAGVAHLR